MLSPLSNLTYRHLFLAQVLLLQGRGFEPLPPTREQHCGGRVPQVSAPPVVSLSAANQDTCASPHPRILEAQLRHAIRNCRWLPVPASLNF